MVDISPFMPFLLLMAASTAIAELATLALVSGNRSIDDLAYNTMVMSVTLMPIGAVLSALAFQAPIHRAPGHFLSIMLFALFLLLQAIMLMVASAVLEFYILIKSRPDKSVMIEGLPNGNHNLT